MLDHLFFDKVYLLKGDCHYFIKHVNKNVWQQVFINNQVCQLNLITVDDCLQIFCFFFSHGNILVSYGSFFHFTNNKCFDKITSVIIYFEHNNNVLCCKYWILSWLQWAVDRFFNARISNRFNLFNIQFINVKGTWSGPMKLLIRHRQTYFSTLIKIVCVMWKKKFSTLIYAFWIWSVYCVVWN